MTSEYHQVGQPEPHLLSSQQVEHEQSMLLVLCVMLAPAWCFTHQRDVSGLPSKTFTAGLPVNCIFCGLYSGNPSLY